MTQGARNLELVSLMAERELFKSFVQMSAVAAAWMDRYGNWLMVNKALCELSGYTEQQWIMTELIGTVIMTRGDRVISLMDCIVEETSCCEVKLFHKNGCSDIQLHLNEVILPSGTSSGYLVQFKEKLPIETIATKHGRDLDQHFKLEQALHLNKQHYKSLFDNHPDAVFSLDMRGCFLTLNESCELITGYSARELFLTMLTNQIHPEDYVQTFDHFLQATNGEAQQFYTRVLHKNGSMIEFRMYFLPIQVDGITMGVYGIAKDITQEKRLIENLRISQEMYKLIEENSFDLIMRCTLDGVMLYISPSCNKMLGYEQHELRGKRYDRYIHPNELSLLEAQLNRQFENQHDSTLYSYRVLHKNGHYVWMETMATLVRDHPEGAGTGLLCVSRDISERKQTEELMLRSEKLLMAGQLAAGIAHEIRNPLTSIKGFLQLLSSQMKDKQGYVDIMNSELNRIEEITSELLLLAKPHEQAFRQHEMNSLLKMVISIMEPQAILNNVQIEGSFGEESLYICCDENQLKQVFVNFIKNAIEAMPQGGELNVHVAKRHNEAIVSIIDQGCGIPAEKLAHIWQPFYTTKEKGTGLGLMVSYSIIENHRGSIHVTSEPDVGTTFSIRIPLVGNQ